MGRQKRVLVLSKDLYPIAFIVLTSASQQFLTPLPSPVSSNGAVPDCESSTVQRTLGIQEHCSTPHCIFKVWRSIHEHRYFEERATFDPYAREKDRSYYFSWYQAEVKAS